MKTKFSSFVLFSLFAAVLLGSACNFTVSLDKQDRQRADTYIKLMKEFSEELTVKEKRLNTNITQMTESIDRLVEQLSGVRKFFEGR